MQAARSRSSGTCTHLPSGPRIRVAKQRQEQAARTRRRHVDEFTTSESIRDHCFIFGNSYPDRTKMDLISRVGVAFRSLRS
ncbi:hypothetical protein, partial [Burkholderia multivorans]|uniref:hypothetical protein n=1 Tax=Burkholderia multivorans TaxID=87883 RepID=UPI001C615170